MKPRFKQSKEIIVRHWLYKNKSKLRVNSNASASTLETTEVGFMQFNFKWNGVCGSIKCKHRVMPSSLIIN